MFFFNLLRQLEDWLHRHVFKVGWLVTKNYQTTTILYYAFFLPGIIVYEFIYWLIAGLLDVRAERSFSMPQKQEIGELRLNFIKLRRVSPLKESIINISPLIVGIAIIWFVANNILDITGALALMNDGTLRNLGASLRQLTTQADFWLWIYLLFTITNTMMPDPDAIAGWVRNTAIVSGIIGILLLFGIGGVINVEIFDPAVQILNTLSGVFALMIALDVIGVAILSLIENTIEWITGDSATFKNGKMITMRRSEAIAARQQERQKALEAKHEQKSKPLLSGTPSIYKFELPLPGAPGRDAPISQKATNILEPEEEPVIIEPARPRREGPSIITGMATRTMVDDDTDDDIEVEIAAPDDANDATKEQSESNVTYEDFEDPA